MAFRRRDAAGSEDDAQEALRQQLLAIEQLKVQLGARVEAVQERERELHEAIAEVRRPRTESGSEESGTESAGQSAELLARREAEIEAREQQLAAREAEVAAAEEALRGKIAAAATEARIAELRAAERLFARTREELAARSEAVAARERLVAQRERELEERDQGPALPPLALGELEARLRRLELREQQTGEETQSFSAGFKRLQRQGSRAHPPGSQ